MKRLLLVLMAMTLLTIPVSAQVNQTIAAVVPIWDASTYQSGAAWIVNEKYVVMSSTKIIRNPITYSSEQNIFVTIAPVDIRKVDTGELIDSLNPNGHIIAFRINESGRIQKVLDIVASANPLRDAVLVTPTGIIYVKSGTTADEIVLYSFDGTERAKYTISDLVNYSTKVTGISPDPLPFIDDAILSPDGKYISVTGRFVNTGYAGGDVFIMDDDLNILSFTPANITKIDDSDIQVFAGEYIVYATNQKDTNISVMEIRTGNVVWHGVGTPVSETTAPVYASGIATPDGKYVFLLKQVDSNTNAARLEVWELTSGGSLILVETRNFTLNFPTETTQPRTAAGLTLYGNETYIAFPAGIIIYNTTTQEYRLFGFNGSYSGRLAAISPQTNYVVMGNKVYMIIRQDIQAKEPRVRFHGTAVFNYGEKPVDLSKPVILEAPKNKPYHVYFEAGSVKITSLALPEKRPFLLTTDWDVRNGMLGKMLDKGLIGYDVIYQDGALVFDHALEKIDDKTIYYYRVHSLTNLVYSRLFGGTESVADSGIIIRIPIAGKASTYTDLYLNQSILIVTAAPLFDWKNELVGIFGIELFSGTSEAAAKDALRQALIKIAEKGQYSKEELLQVSEILHQNAIGYNAMFQALARSVGVAVMPDVPVTVLTRAANYANVKTTIFVVPIVEDTRTGDTYAAVVYVLPSSEIARKAEYTNYVKTFLKNNLGVRDVGVTFIEWGTDWSEYNEKLRGGQIPPIKLGDLIETQVSARNNIPMSQLRFKEVAIVIDTVTRGYASLWDLIGGGSKIPVVTIASGRSIEISGVVNPIYTTDPEEIVSLLPTIEINGQRYNLAPSPEGAITHFTLPLGTQKLVITFPDSPYLATLRVDTDTLIKAPFIDETYGIMKAEFHYDWENVLILLDKIEFVDMPYPMKYAERTFRYKYGEFSHDMTEAFELNQTVDDPTSPTGKRYYYVTKENTEYIDPANGGMMQPCKTYIFRYFYVDKAQIGNAWVQVYFNGTAVTSTIPRHASLYVGSNGTSQTVSGTLTVATKYKDPSTNQIVTVLEETYDWSEYVPAGSSILIEYDIEKFVAKAQELLTQGKVGFVEVYARITNAEVNYITSDDEARVIYYPPPTLPEYGAPVVLSIKAVDKITGDPVANATVVVDGVDTYTTDANGWANISTTVGLHTINVSATGYFDYSDTVNVYDNMTYIAYLEPLAVTKLEGWVRANITFRVIDYLNGTPIAGAKVCDGSWDVCSFTDSNGETWFYYVLDKPEYHIYWAEADGYETSPKHEIYITTNMTYTIYLVPANQTLPPELNTTPIIDENNTQIEIPMNQPVYIVNNTTYVPLVVLVQYADGTPFDGAQITVYNNSTGSVIVTGMTDGTGYSYLYVEQGMVVDVEAVAGNYTFTAKRVWMTVPRLIIFTINQTTAYFTPEVAISDVKIIIHRGQGWFYGNVSHFILTYLWTNVPQTVDLYLRLFDTQNNTVSEKTVTGIQLVPGVNAYMEWLDVNVSKEFKNVTIYAKIVNFQQDTNLSNNELIGNTVTLKPFLDMYATVIWYPIKQKVSNAILPEDVIEIDVGFVIPAKITGVQIRAKIEEFNLNEKALKTIEGRSETVATFEPTTIWRNFTIKVPFTDRIVVTANITHELEDFILNNNITLEIPIYPDTKVEYAKPATLIVSSGSPTAVTVKIQSNAFGRLYTVEIWDDDLKEILAMKDVNITEPNMTVTLEAKAPKISGFQETHTWNVTFAGADYYPANNYYSFNVTIWGIPWWAILLGILLIVLFLLATIRAILATVEDRARPRFRYFRKLDGESVSSRHMTSTEERAISKFKFFRRLKP